jgi:hypothetical protein
VSFSIWRVPARRRNLRPDLRATFCRIAVGLGRDGGVTVRLSLTAAKSRRISRTTGASRALAADFTYSLFRDVLAAGGRLDVFMAGDDAQSLGLRPQDTGDLSMAHWLEGAGLLSVGLGRYGVGDFNFSLGVKFG